MARGAAAAIALSSVGGGQQHRARAFSGSSSSSSSSSSGGGRGSSSNSSSRGAAAAAPLNPTACENGQGQQGQTTQTTTQTTQTTTHLAVVRSKQLRELERVALHDRTLAAVRARLATRQAARAFVFGAAFAFVSCVATSSLAMLDPEVRTRSLARYLLATCSLLAFLVLSVSFEH